MNYNGGGRRGSAHLGISTNRFGVSLDRHGDRFSADVRIGHRSGYGGYGGFGGGLAYDGYHIRSIAPYYNHSPYGYGYGHGYGYGSAYGYGAGYGYTRYGLFGHFNTADYYPYRRNRSYGYYGSSYYSPYYGSYGSPYDSSYYSVGFGSPYYASSYYAQPYSGQSSIYYDDGAYDRGDNDYDVDVYGTTNVYVNGGEIEYASPPGDSSSEIQYEQVAPYQESSPPILESPPSDQPAMLIEPDASPDQAAPEPVESPSSDQDEASRSVEPDVKAASAAEPFFNQGYRAFVAGDYDQAVERYTDALLAGEERGLSSLMYGVSAFALGEYATAGAAVRRSVLLRPDLIDSPIDLRSMYADPMVLDGQLGRLANFVRLNQENRSAKFLLAYLHFAALQPEYTATLAEELTKADPNDGLAKHLYDQAKQATRKAQNALEDEQP